MQKRGAEPVFVSDASAGRSGEREGLEVAKTDVSAPCGEVAGGEVKGVAELDEHVERHHEPERVFAASVVDEVFDDDVGASIREGLIGRAD